MKRTILTIATLAALALAGCGAAATPQKETLTGAVTYRERMALPDDALVTVLLIDTSAEPDATIGEHIFESGGKQVPLAFSVSYDPSAIREENTYVLYATISVAGELVFTSAEDTPVLTGGNPSKDITLNLVSALSKEEKMQEAFVTGTVIYRERMALPGNALITVQVQDTTLADAPAVTIGEVSFESGGKQVPIPFSVGYDPAAIDESRIYTIRATITLDGKLSWTTDTLVRVINNGNPTEGIELMLVRVSGGEGGMGASDPLLGTVWKWQKTVTPVEEIVPSDPARYTIEFSSDGKYGGLSDCNRILGSYTVDGSSITINPGATTLIACPEGSLDQVFNQQLTSAAVYFFKDGHLFIDLIYDSGTMEFAP